MTSQPQDDSINVLLTVFLIIIAVAILAFVPVGGRGGGQLGGLS